MSRILTELREEEQTEHEKINNVLSALDSTSTDCGVFERLRRLETIAETMKGHIADLEAARAKDLAEQAALGRRVHFTIVALLVAVAGIVAPSILKALQQ